MKRSLLLALATAALPVLLWVPPAAAATFDLGTFETTPGDVCVVTDQNNSSAWPGNVLVIDNGGSIVTLDQVEDEPDTSFSVRLVSNGTIKISVEAEVFSSLEVAVDCTPPPPPTTPTTEPTTVVTPPEPTPPPTTPPPTPPPTTPPPTPPPTTPTTPPDRDCGPDKLACSGNRPLVPAAFLAIGLVATGVVLVMKP